MAIFTMSDLHLSLDTDKSMEVFGRAWENYIQRIQDNWSRLVKDSDTVIVGGDISWAMSYTGAKEDFLFLHGLNGKKIISKGNHDYWWTSKKKLDGLMSELGIDDIQFLHNNAYSVENYIIAGSRGWYIDENNKNAPDAADFDKIVAREVIRLEISLKEAVKLRGDTDREIIVFLHFPPVMGGFVCEPIVELLKKYGIKRCYYGHIHGVYDIPPSFEYEGITYFITSADFLEFTPLIIR